MSTTVIPAEPGWYMLAFSICDGDIGAFGQDRCPVIAWKFTDDDKYDEPVFIDAHPECMFSNVLAARQDVYDINVVVAGPFHDELMPPDHDTTEAWAKHVLVERLKLSTPPTRDELFTTG